MSGFADTLRLGLIGGNITATRSPALHVLCGLATGLNVTYDLLIPTERGRSFPSLLRQCADLGFAGVNITYPYKEEAAAMVPAGDPLVAAMGASNTVRFTPDGPRAFNTDHSGFVAAFRARFGARAPGRVLILGSGGVGRAVAFGLASLGAAALELFDTDAAKADSLAAALSRHAPMPVSVAGANRRAALDGIDGVVNCTPLGMVGRPGSALPEGAAGRPGWSFDAVYTPADTAFRARTEAMGAAFLSGWELYFHQGLRAFEIFSGRPVGDPDRVRAILTHRPAG